MHVLILGTRGIPARHGGFETFAEDLALFLTRNGHCVTVYCQSEAKNEERVDWWKGIRRVLIPAGSGPLGTVAFDWKSVKNASRETGVALTLGYNTAILNLLFRLRGIPNLINMDGIEWKRDKWTFSQRLWLRLNEWLGARIANHLIADHPEIKKHLMRHTASEKISMIPYGADAVTRASIAPIEKMNLRPNEYYLIIARPEPENSILEMVRAFSRKHRGANLVVLGEYNGAKNSYQAKVLAAASDEVIFCGPIYDHNVVTSLRFYAKAYFHGHRVGGTNPSLVESLAAGNAVIAHRNRFTRWVAGDGAMYFSNENDINDILDLLESSPDVLARMRSSSRRRHAMAFRKEQVCIDYERLLSGYAALVGAVSAASQESHKVGV